MTELITILTLALVQGLTEFLPISSSAHLILVPMLTGWTDPGLAFDIAVHMGTLLAVCIYFRRDLLRLWGGWVRSLQGRATRVYSRLAWYLIIATIPVIIIGALAHDFVATSLRSPFVIAFATITFALLLALSDKFPKRNKYLSQMRIKDVLIIGMAQVLALIPGTSRSGITLTAGLSLGFNRISSAKFSFLLSIPAILLAGGYEGVKAVTSGTALPWLYVLTGIGVAAISAYFCIHTFLKLISKMGVMPFVWYRLMLGLYLIWFFS